MLKSSQVSCIQLFFENFNLSLKSLKSHTPAKVLLYYRTLTTLWCVGESCLPSSHRTQLMRRTCRLWSHWMFCFNYVILDDLMMAITRLHRLSVQHAVWLVASTYSMLSVWKQLVKQITVSVKFQCQMSKLYSVFLSGMSQTHTLLSVSF